MAIDKVKVALERHLSTMTPAVQTAFEGVSFKPTAGTMYQRAQLRIDDPDDPVLGKGYYRERVQFQVFVVAPSNKGTGAAIARAQLIRERFKKGTSLTESGVVLHVLETPRISGATSATDRVIVPVLINVVAEVAT